MADRTHTFHQDADIYGKYGEMVFNRWASSNNKFSDVLDVSDPVHYPFFNYVDVDYLVLRRGYETTSGGLYSFFKYLDPNTVNCTDHFTRFHQLMHDNGIMKIEVKCDTKIKDTRNIAYEVIAYDKPGCLAYTSADYVFYVSTDEHISDVYGAWMLNMGEVRRCLRNSCTDKRHVCWKAHTVTLEKNNCMNLLLNIDHLMSDSKGSRFLTKQELNFAPTPLANR